MPKEESKPTTAPTPVDSQVEKYRIRKAFWLAVFGLFVAALLVVILLAYGFKESNDIVAIVGLFTSVLGTLVGAFFGLQIGSAGKAQSDQRADKADQRSNAIISAADVDVVKKAQRAFPEAFK